MSKVYHCSDSCALFAGDDGCKRIGAEPEPAAYEDDRELPLCPFYQMSVRLIAGAREMYDALKEIAQGKGRYSQDRLTHASNTIEDMKAAANKALAVVNGGE